MHKLLPAARAACRLGLHVVVIALAGFGTAFAADKARAEPGVTDSEILIGQSITLQGGKNAYGVAAHHGMKLYIDQVNAAGGLHGRRIVVKTLDDDNRNATAEANARKLVDEGAFMLFGAVEGGPSTAVMKVAAERKVPFFGPMAGPPALRRPHQEWVFPVRAEHRDEFRALMEWGKSLGMKTVGFFHVDSANGKEHLGNVNMIAKELGLQVVLSVPFKPDTSDTDLERFVGQIRDAKPDLLFNHGSAALYEKLVSKALRAGLRTRFVGVNSGSTQIARSLGPLAQGMVFAQVVPSPWERKREITREYQEAARRADPKAEFSYGGMEGFLTAKALVMALRAAGKDLTRTSFARSLRGSTFDLGGVKVQYTNTEHTGSRFVDLSMVDRNGRFIH
ncbi:MAG: ABC transporter substrate-binding protein [Rubrivivax sp.]|nr:ABC transporter substrate-binding protein [Rubrivivax sp.]